MKMMDELTFKELLEESNPGVVVEKYRGRYYQIYTKNVGQSNQEEVVEEITRETIAARKADLELRRDEILERIAACDLYDLTLENALEATVQP